MWTAIFRFEIRYHLQQPLFYLVTFALGVLLFIAGTDHGAGRAGRLHLNAPAVILEQLIKGIYLVLFLMTAFVASAAVRDFDRRTSELFFSKPISRFDYLTGAVRRNDGGLRAPVPGRRRSPGGEQLHARLDPARLGPFRLHRTRSVWAC